MDNFEIKLIPYELNIQNDEVSNALNSYISNTKEYTPYGVNMINSTFMWKNNFKGKGITIAVIDTGCATKHPDLVGQIIGGRNFTEEDKANPDIYEDYNGHGTHVCGTIAARAQNSGLVGVAPEAKLLILKVLNKNGSGNLQNLINAVEYAITQKVDIISMSLGGPSDLPQLHDAIKLATEKNILVVCAAGNEGDKNANTNEFAYPGSYNEVISVGAVDERKSAARFTNSNKEVDLVAPGVNITSTFINDSYRNLSGTSMATPHVSGALALIKQWAKDAFGRELTESEIYAQLIKNTTELKMQRTLQGNGLLYLNVKNL